MKKWIGESFARRQLVCFLVVALLPLLISSLFLTHLVKVKVERDYEKVVTGQAEQVEAVLTETFEKLEATVKNICENKEIASMISIIGETDSWTRNQTYTQLYQETMSQRDYAQFDIYDRDGICIYSTGNEERDKELPVYWGILKAASDRPGELVFLRADDLEETGKVLLQGASCILDEKGTLQGYVVVSMGEENFDRILQGTFNSQEGIAILDPYFEIVYSAGTAQAKRIGDILREQLMEGEKLISPGGSNGIYISPLGDTGMCKVLLRPEVFSGDIVQTMYRIVLMVAVASFLLCVLIAKKMSSSLTFPIKRINEAIQNLERGNLETRIPVDRQDELGQMSENFNIMATKLQHYMEEKVQAKQQLNDSYIAMMHAQMNPHFLYNTLDTMKWLAKANHVPEIATMSAGLARILRTSISKEQFIRLKEEIELVVCYADIQKIRFSDRFCLLVSMPEELASCIVPKLVVQPIVENAVIHGLEDREDGLVEVRIYRKRDAIHGEAAYVAALCEDTLYIEVKDNGCGIDEEIMESLNSRDNEKLSGHIGFHNADTIIRLCYGEQYGLQVSRPEDGGTLVTIRLPAITEQNGK